MTTEILTQKISWNDDVSLLLLNFHAILTNLPEFTNCKKFFSDLYQILP